MNLDELLYRLPLIGWVIKRLYNYFKRQTAMTDFFHVLVGLGIGFIIAGDQLLNYGIFILAIGILFHIYAFIKG